MQRASFVDQIEVNPYFTDNASVIADHPSLA